MTERGRRARLVHGLARSSLARGAASCSVVVLTSLSFPPRAVAAEPTKDECINANEAAQKLRDTAKLRAARAQLEVCVARSCPGPVRDDCTERLAEIDRAMPTIVVVATGPDGKELTLVRVKMDDELVAERIDGPSGAPIRVDPGTHAFQFEAAGLAVVTRKIVLVEGQKNQRIEVSFGDAPGGAREGPATDVPGAPPPARPAGSFQLGGRVGYALPAGSVTGVESDSLSSSFGGQLSFLVDLGYKLDEHILIGAYASGKAGLAGGTSTDCELPENRCSSAAVHLGLQVQYHVRPAETLNPWVGFGAGWEFAGQTVTLATPQAEKGLTVHGPEIARLMGGLDYRASKLGGFGPYADLALGTYVRKTVTRDGVELSSESVDEVALHAWLTLGLRVVVWP